MSQQKDVAFKFKALLGVPTKSRNGNIWTKELMQQVAGKFAEKVILFDHDWDCGAVTGVISESHYGTDINSTGNPMEGIWASGVGLMSESMWAKVHGTESTPPFFKGGSMGGFGDDEWNKEKEGWELKSFEPMEFSFTPFPSIKEAEFTQLQRIAESYSNKQEVQKVPDTIVEKKEEPKVESHVARTITEADVAEAVRVGVAEAVRANAVKYEAQLKEQQEKNDKALKELQEKYDKQEIAFQALKDKKEMPTEVPTKTPANVDPNPSISIKDALKATNGNANAAMRLLTGN
jgi:hypothetical protein